WPASWFGRRDDPQDLARSSDRGVHDLGTLDGDPAGTSVAFGINASGTVVGSSSGSGGQRAFVYQNGVLRDLGTPVVDEFSYSIANGINTAGDIVGEMNGTAFLYHDGSVVDVNTLVDHNDDGWPRIVVANGINDAGQIVGRAYFGDRPGT